jgi:uncharacterized protein (DUF1499 family)
MGRIASAFADRRLSLGAAGSALLGLLFLPACAGERPKNLGVTAARLAPCPASPNCVTSDGNDDDRRVSPFALAVSATEAWPVATHAVSELAGARIVAQTDTYLHAECSSRVFGFVDDLELHLRAADKIIGVRSASRVGYWDLGANRRRVEELRRLLVQKGVIF